MNELPRLIVAIYVLHALNEQEIEIKNIAVTEPLQGKGIGTYLLNDAFLRAKQQYFTSVLIGTAYIPSRHYDNP